MTDFDKQEQKWIPLIGEFILDFVTIEDLINYTIDSYAYKLKLDKEDITDKFEQRLNLFKKIIKQNVDEKEISELTEKIKKLKDVRNLIAHNGLKLKTGVNEFKIIGFEIVSSKNANKSLNFIDFKKRVKELKQCRIEIQKLTKSARLEDIKNHLQKRYNLN